MQTFINSPFHIGNLKLPHRLIQGPLAGYSCAPFRELFAQFTRPAYCVSEMTSAKDILHQHTAQSRYLYRSPKEQRLAYQIAGNEKEVLAKAAIRLEEEGADLIDINCGCPKTKIRKKGSGSALLEKPDHLMSLIETVKARIKIPLTIKIRIQGNEQDLSLAKRIEDAGADALIVHGRRWVDDYDVPCDWLTIGQIKQAINIPVIANGDIHDAKSLKKAIDISACDAFMIARAGSGRPWLYQELLEQQPVCLTQKEQINLFMTHLQGLAALENEYKAILQSKRLVRYYFKTDLTADLLRHFYLLTSLEEVHDFLQQL